MNPDPHMSFSLRFATVETTEIGYLRSDIIADKVLIVGGQDCKDRPREGD